MANSYPYPRSRGVISIGLGIVLAIVTCGIYGLVWQYRQMAALNAWLGRDEYSFWLWFALSIVTCGIFAMYYEYKMAKGINEVQERFQLRIASDLAVICLILTIVGLGLVSIAIQQAEINKFYNADVDF